MTIASLPSALRSWETYVCRTFAAVAGGRPAQRSSISRSLRHGLVRVQQQDRQERTWLRRLQRDDAAFGYRFERPEYAEVHSDDPPPNKAAAPALYRR